MDSLEGAGEGCQADDGPVMERLLLLLAVLNIALVCALLMASFYHLWPFDW
jgi:hypothetical protein